MLQRNTWQRFGLFTLVGLLLSGLISCASGPMGTTPAGKTEVEFWTMQLQPKFTTYFEQLIDAFEQENPDLTVRWVDVPWAAMQSKILTAVSAKTAPDVVNLNPDFALQLAGRNAWLDLNGKVSPEQRALYLPNIWKASTLNDQSFGLPWYLTSRIAIYNQDLFQQAGIAEPPQTYAELATVAQQVKAKTGKYATFISFVPEDSAELLESLVQMGVTLVDDQGRAAFNSPVGKAAFRYWIDLYQRKLLPPEVLTEGHRRAVDLYQSGQIALLASSPQFLTTIATNAPDIAKASAAAPQITGDTGLNNVAVMNLIIPRDTDQPNAALKFALYVTNPDNQLAFAKAGNVLPSTQVSLEDSYFRDVPADATAADQARVVSAKQLQDAQVLLPAIEDIKQLQKIIYENLQAAMIDRKTVDQAIADAEQEWNQKVAG